VCAGFNGTFRFFPTGKLLCLMEVIDKHPDILYPPHCGHRAEFYRCGEPSVLTPAHQVDLEAGMIAGAPVLGLPRICDKRRNPVSGNVFMAFIPCYRERCIPSLSHGIGTEHGRKRAQKSPHFCGFVLGSEAKIRSKFRIRKSFV